MIQVVTTDFILSQTDRIMDEYLGFPRLEGTIIQP